MKSLFSPDSFNILPIERSETIPSSWYTDEEVFDLDCKAIFGRHWQLAGHESRLLKTGDQIPAMAGREPIFLVRDQEGTIRTFYNVCRHRGGPIVTDAACAKVLQCKYHGWTYLLDGSLRGVPQFDRAELFDKKDFGLVPVPAERWNGLIFVNPEGEGVGAKGIPHLNNVLAGISERIAPIAPGKFQFHSRHEYEIQCNWKVYVDNYLEGYHLPHVHPELCKLLDYQNYVTETSEWYSLQHSPFREGENLYGVDNGEAFYYFIFPNIMLNILPGRMQTNVVLPVASDRTRVIFEYYYEDLASLSSLAVVEDDIAYSDKIQQEDIEICELVQRGLGSRAYDKGRFSVECEQGVYHFQSLLKRSYKEALNL